MSVLTAVGGANAAPAGWSAPQDLSDNFEAEVFEGSTNNFPDIDVSGSGAAVAVWQREEQFYAPLYKAEIWTRDRPLGGVWSPPRLLGAGTNPRVATNAGTTAIAWVSDGGVLAVVRRPGGDYSDVRNLGPGAEVHVGVDDAGAVTVLWSGGGTGFGIRAARNVAASGWAATKTISFSTTARTPDLAVSGNGDALAAWAAQDGVRMSEFTGPAGWTDHYLVAPGGKGPSIAVNDAGQFVLAWVLAVPVAPGSAGAPTESVHGLTGAVRGAHTADQTLSGNVVIDSGLENPIPEAAIGMSGDAVVVWNQSIFDTSRLPDATVQAASVKPAGPWSSTRSISVPLHAPRPSVAVLPDGAVIAVWRGGYAAWRSADQADRSDPRWDAPFVLSDPGSDVYDPDVAVDDAGRVHVLWADLSRPHTRFEDHIAFMAVQATRFGLPGSAPGLVSPGVPAAGAHAPSVPKIGDGLHPKKAPATLPKPKVTTVLKHGTLYLKVSAKLSRNLSGRTLVIQRLSGRKVLRLASLRVPASGRITKLIALNTNSNRGASGVRDVQRIQVRITVAKTSKAAAISSALRAVSV